MKKTILITIFLLSNLYSLEIPSKSVVKIFSAVSYYNYDYPWQAPNIYNFTGSGAIIEGNQILTSAHVVSGAKFIEVLKEGDPNKYIAKLKFISNQADLALLELEDVRFFKDTLPLSLSQEIKHRDAITVLGYPIGGDTIATTTGVISRIEYTYYSWNRNNLLSIQIDAAINSGNSGGPVVNQEGKLIGIAMQMIKDASNIGYIVPSAIIKTFLDDVQDGVVDGLHSNATTIESIENPAMKKFYNLKDDGVLVTFVDMQDKELRVGDIILAIDGIKIANNSTIQSSIGRVDFRLALHSKQVGQSVSLKILRDKKEMDITYALKYSDPLIKQEFSQEPKYFIYGGLVFEPLTYNYLKGPKENANSYNMLFYEQSKSEKYSEPVVLTRTMFPHSVNRGYKPYSAVVKAVNGEKMRDFAHFVKTVLECKKEYIVIDFIEKKQVILSTKEARKSFGDIQKTYGLKNDKRL